MAKNRPAVASLTRIVPASGLGVSLGLTPAGDVRWTDPGVEEIPERLQHLERAFDADWREALFTLAAEKTDTRERPAVRYWQSFAERHLTALCHLPAVNPNAEGAASLSVEPPTSAECAALVEGAPPMIGGEYLSAERLQRIWTEVDDWVSQAASTAGGLSAFLRERAPNWHQVGRVCFHLAENRNDAARPFAFMATYAARFGATGRARHLPLRRALEQYAGENNRSALITLLSPIQQAAAACDWVREMVDSGDVYRPMAWTPDRAYRLLRSVPELEESGLSVRLPDWWRKRARPQVSVTVGEAPSLVGRGRRARLSGRGRSRRRAALRRRPECAARQRRQSGAPQGSVGRGGPRSPASGDRALGCRASGGRRPRHLLHRGNAPPRRRVGRSSGRGGNRGRTPLGSCRGRRRHARDPRRHASTRDARPRRRRRAARDPAAVSTRWRGMACPPDPPGPRRLSGRRHGPGQDHSSAGVAALPTAAFARRSSGRRRYS